MSAIATVGRDGWDGPRSGMAFVVDERVPDTYLSYRYFVANAETVAIGMRQRSGSVRKGMGSGPLAVVARGAVATGRSRARSCFRPH